MREDFFDDQLEPISPTDSERVRQLANAFSVSRSISIANPGLSLRSNRWAEISERLRR
jgi:hypothetical protein